MSKQDPSDQVRFLVACIINTTNGRPDFEAVAKHLDIVSKAAAQKRYERMLKAHGVTGKAAAKATNDDTSAQNTPVKKRKVKTESDASPKPKRGRKAKLAKVEEDDDDDKGFKSEDSDSKDVKKETDGDSSPLSEAPESA